LDKHAAATKDARRVSRSLEDSRDERERSLERENDKVREHEKAIDNLTVHALRSFAQAFTKSDKFDDSITRMCSIWLAHADSKNASDDNEKRRADGIAQAFASFISSVPSYKFIFLGPQLAARLHLSSQKRPFDHQLNGVMLRLAQDHPFHILYQVVPLASSAPAAAKGRKSMPAADAAEGRGPAANWLLQQLEADQVHTTARQASRHMRAFADIVTAYCWVKPPSRDESNGRGVKVGNAAISRLPSDMDIPVATVIPTVRPDRNYSDVPRLTRYSSTYDILGGVHRPRKMKCYDSASNTHFQIFKGDDEIRQDAIMEQVFGMTNNILKRDRQTKARRLNFRTYVVIPLANKTGIIEFCAEGIALGDWLKPAHDRYRRPEDLKASAIREIMFSLQGKVPDVELIQRWKAETPRFPPVMRHFFREKQPEPMAWFTMRLNYARSVAVTSMVGHMLGIGDRHLSNVMIDQVNGELIHIDFGIVFEEVSHALIMLSRVTADHTGPQFAHPRTRSVPLDSRHDRWSRRHGRRRYLQAMLRADPTCPSIIQSADHDRTRGLQARPLIRMDGRPGQAQQGARGQQGVERHFAGDGSRQSGPDFEQDQGQAKG
jgi:ataxia telangiectasia mutated family protein